MWRWAATSESIRKMLERLLDGLYGLLAGAFMGALAGLGVCVWIFDEPIFFQGDTILAGGCICAVLGFTYGESFFDWLRENWWWFW